MTAKPVKSSNTSDREKERELFSQIFRHYQLATEETDKRRTGRGRMGSISFDEADELFRSWINEKKWPYDALIFDPRVFTFIFEKTSRLFANRLRGKLIPREGGDVLGAHINNELLNFQWDQATQGGSMLAKWAMKDLNTRKYGSAFSIHKWRYELSPDKKVIFDGPEMKVLANRDCLPDPTATSIESANWFQVREIIKFQDLQNVNDQARSAPVYKNLDILRDAIGGEGESGGDKQSTNWMSRNREISNLTVDPYGRDEMFKDVEIVTEYQRDRWITFSPKHGVVLRDIPNPYGNYEIPIVMLRYYQIDDDLYGLSEIEPVKGLQKAINALLNEYLDEINQKLYTPIAISPGVKQYTLEWGKGARWQMNNPMTDFKLVESQAGAIQFFNNTYSALVSSMMNAIGESSLGVSNIGNFQKDKTATEVKEVVQQRNARDSFNQNFLSEAIERQMMLWHAMNQKMLFADKSKQTYIVRIVGSDAIKYFQQRGLDKYGPSHEATQLAQQHPELNIKNLETPLYPVQTGQGDTSQTVSKFSMDDGLDSGTLVVEPTDIRGNYDYIADVESMALGAGDTEKTGRDQAMKTILTSPNALQLLEKEGVKPKFKELLVAWLNDSGFKDAEKFFESDPQSSSLIDMQKMQASKQPPPQKTPTVSINYKDLPPDGQTQAAGQAGIQLQPSTGTTGAQGPSMPPISGQNGPNMGQSGQGGGNG